MNYKQEFTLKRRRAAKIKLTGKVLGACVVALGLTYLLFFARLFDVRSLEIHTPSIIPASDVQRVAIDTLEGRVFGIPRKRNMILFSPQKIRSQLIKDIPRIKDVVIKRKTFHVLEITVTERQAVGMWCLVKLERCYYFDEGGTAFAEQLPTTGYLFIAINDSRDRSIELGHAVAPSAWRDHILEVKRHLQFGGISIQEVQIPATSYEEFHVVTREGWKILMSNDTNINRQITAMLQFLKQNFTSDQRHALQYIDLRVDDRIYYK